MSYKALYRTHRPTTFDEVVGQEHITNTLKNIIRKDKVSHAYLFAGPRGTGKTSVAHVFAKTLNCSDLVDPSKPCNGCQQCLTVPSLDIVEIDAASNNGVADIRTLIDNAKYAPSISKYKVYIIDEVHMLSKGAFNALLKTLEEPPKHVVFILATTEPHKIPVTILSRTQRFNFRRINEEVIGRQLVNVLKAENITFDNESIRMISKLSNGGMRDALSIADQASAFSNGNITFRAIAQVFGIISTGNQIKLITLAYSKKTKDLLSLSTEFINNGGDIERMTGSLIDILKDFIVYSKTQDKSLITLLTEEEVSNFGISITFAYKAIDVLMKLLSDLRISEVPKQAFELSLLKITESGNENIIEEVPVLKKSVEKPKEEIIEKVVETNEENVPEKVDVFSKEELTETSEEVFTPEKLEKLKEEIESTKEFEIPQQIIEEQEEAQMLSEVEDDILSTQEIPIAEIKEETVLTKEVDVEQLFSLEGEDLTKEVEVPEVRFKLGEIINLLAQANRKYITLVKKSWESILTHSSNPKYGTYANLLGAAKIISVGEDFILMSSDDTMVISQINAVRKEKNFIEFLTALFGKPLLVFAITKDEFKAVKEEWGMLSRAGRLPKPKPVEKIKITKKEMSEAEDFGTTIFGDMLKS